MVNLIEILHQKPGLMLYLICLKGISNKSRDYKVEGSELDKIFNVFGAISAICFSSTAGMIPETQVSAYKCEFSIKIYKISRSMIEVLLCCYGN